jgi:NADH-quinone oxidoreductase subunit F
MGTPMDVVIHQLGGGFRLPVKAIHIGGPLGGLVPVDKLSLLTIDFESFAQNGFLLGHASFVCIPKDYPLVEYIKHLFQLLHMKVVANVFLVVLVQLEAMNY